MRSASLSSPSIRRSSLVVRCPSCWISHRDATLAPTRCSRACWASARMRVTPLRITASVSAAKRTRSSSTARLTTSSALVAANAAAGRRSRPSCHTARPTRTSIITTDSSSSEIHRTSQGPSSSSRTTISTATSTTPVPAAQLTVTEARTRGT